MLVFRSVYSFRHTWSIFAILSNVQLFHMFYQSFANYSVNFPDMNFGEFPEFIFANLCTKEAKPEIFQSQIAQLAGVKRFRQWDSMNQTVQWTVCCIWGCDTPPKFNIAPEKMVVGRLVSYWEGNSSGAMLNFGRVTIAPFQRCNFFSNCKLDGHNCCTSW